MKTSDLVSPALDWAVAKCEKVPRAYLVPDDFTSYQREGKMCYSTNCNQGCPIMFREHIEMYYSHNNETWSAFKNTTDSDGFVGGLDLTMVDADPMVAAMRCYVAHILGLEVDIPEELMP